MFEEVIENLHEKNIYDVLDAMSHIDMMSCEEARTLCEKYNLYNKNETHLVYQLLLKQYLNELINNRRYKQPNLEASVVVDQWLSNHHLLKSLSCQYKKPATDTMASTASQQVEELLTDFNYPYIQPREAQIKYIQEKLGIEEHSAKNLVVRYVVKMEQSETTSPTTLFDQFITIYRSVDMEQGAKFNKEVEIKARDMLGLKYRTIQTYLIRARKLLSKRAMK